MSKHQIEAHRALCWARIIRLWPHRSEADCRRRIKDCALALRAIRRST